MMIYVCADDYGLTEKTCERIEECITNGALNKISIFPNTGMADIKKRIPKENITLSMHINLVEGKAVSPPQEVSLLTDGEGYFKHSFVGLMLRSFSCQRKKFEEQIYREIKNQFKRWKEVIGSDVKVAVDTHQHTHMIPGIFKMLMKVIKEEDINVTYLRIPSEPLLPYIKTPSLYHTYKPQNLLKQWLLKLFGLINKKRLKSSGIKTALFMGVLFSGRMDEKRVKKLLPGYLKLAKKKNQDIELLFHPGYAENGEPLWDERKKGFVDFYLSEGRKIEYDAVRNMEIK